MSNTSSTRPVPPTSRPSENRGTNPTALPNAHSQKPVAQVPLGCEGLTATNLRDQEGGFQFRFKRGDQETVLSAETVADPAALGQGLTKAGIVALTPAVRTYAQRLAQSLPAEAAEPCIVVRQPGHDAGVFVFPDGRVFGGSGSAAIVQLAAPLTLDRAGASKAWRAAMRRFGTGQSYVIFVLALALTGMVLDLLPYEGAVLIETEGADSRGKTTLLRVAASVWGSPGGRGSIAAGWRMSKVGLQHLMFARSSAFLPIDEVNTAGLSQAKQAEAVGDATFFLEKGENNVTDRDRQVRYARACVLSTANDPISEVLSGFSRRSAQAAEVRFISVPIEGGAGLGFWSSVPKGFDSPAEAAEALSRAVRENHGWAAAAFARRLMRLHRADEAGLRARLLGYAERFLAKVSPQDGSVRRRAIKFACIYAAGRLATELDVLPFENIGPHIKAVWERAEARYSHAVQSRLTPLGELRQHVAQHGASIIDLDVVEPPNLSTGELDACPGFRKTIKGQRYLLLRGAALVRLFGADDRAAIRALLDGGRLLTNEGNQLQTRVRIQEDKTRVYAARLG